MMFHVSLLYTIVVCIIVGYMLQIFDFITGFNIKHSADFRNCIELHIILTAPTSYKYLYSLFLCQSFTLVTVAIIEYWSLM